MIQTLAALLLLSAAASAQDANYPTFRGANRDGHSPDTGLAKEWPASGPALLWKTTGIGGGYAGVSVWGDKAFTQGDFGPDTKLFAFNTADGKILWSAPIGKTFRGFPDKPTWQGNRATPSTDGKLVVVLGPMGDLVCYDLEGKEKWRRQLKDEFGGKVGNWLYSESPLIDGDQIPFICGGSKGAVAAVKKDTGETIWQCKEFTDDAEYPSLVPVEIGGIRQYLAFTQKSLAGISAKEGKLLWKQDRKGAVAVIPTPIYKDGILYVTSGYNIGQNGFKITADGGAFKTEQIYAGKELMNHHGGAILVGDHVYGTDDKSLRCVELKTGKLVWENPSVGKGSIAYADGLLVVRSEKEKSGAVALVEASPAGYKELGRFTQPEIAGKPLWAHPTLIGGKLYLRDHDLLLCYSTKAK